MGEAAGGKPPRVFDCAVCNLSVPYSWHGRRPKFGEQLVFVEDVYMTAKPHHLAVPLLTPRASVTYDSPCFQSGNADACRRAPSQPFFLFRSNIACARPISVAECSMLGL
jgi:hypothetical protein